MTYPDAVDPDMVGEYPAQVFAGGGYVWDEVLEYRVWCHPTRGAFDLSDGSDYYFAYATYEEARRVSAEHVGAEVPLALILQREYIDEPTPGEYRHIRRERVTEWPVEFLAGSRRDDRTIPDLLSSKAPINRLKIVRGEDPRPET